MRTPRSAYIGFAADDCCALVEIGEMAFDYDNNII